MNDRLVWIDCEMTGLDLGADALIEVAALVTDFDLNVLGDGVDLVIKPAQEALDGWLVLEVHEARADTISSLLATLSYVDVTISPDLASKPRVVEARWQTSTAR